MLDQKTAKYAASLSWRFILCGQLVMFFLAQVLPAAQLNDVEQGSSSLLPLAFLVGMMMWIYCSMYLSLMWFGWKMQRKKVVDENKSNTTGTSIKED